MTNYKKIAAARLRRNTLHQDSTTCRFQDTRRKPGRRSVLARFMLRRVFATHRSASVVDSDSYSSSFAVAASDLAAASGPIAVCAACALTYACVIVLWTQRL